MTLEQHEKRLSIFNNVVGAAQDIAALFKDPIPNARLLTKRAFPDRYTPHRIKRARKKEAQATAVSRMGQAMMKMYLAAASHYAIASAPIARDYPSGGFIPNSKLAE